MKPEEQIQQRGQELQGKREPRDSPCCKDRTDFGPYKRVRELHPACSNVIS